MASLMVPRPSSFSPSKCQEVSVGKILMFLQVPLDRWSTVSAVNVYRQMAHPDCAVSHKIAALAVAGEFGQYRSK